jgi:hypothetical protein
MLMAKDLFGFEKVPVAVRLRAERGEALRWFNEHINDETDHCIIWPFNRNRDGYGLLWMNGKHRRVSVLVCEIKHGQKPDREYEARHGPCHNTLCLNYRHLSWGTSSDNKLDKIRDGTDSRGVKNPRVKLIDKEIIEIHKLHSQGLAKPDIAKKFGVTSSAIHSIIKGKTWKHVVVPKIQS